MIEYTRQHLKLIHIVRVRGVFHDDIILITTAAHLIKKTRV